MQRAVMLALAILAVTAGQASAQIEVLAGGGLDMNAGSEIDAPSVSVTGAGADLTLDEDSTLRIAPSGTITVGDAVNAGTLTATGATDTPTITTTGTSGTDHYGFSVGANGTLAVSALNLISTNTGGLSLAAGATVDNGTAGQLSGVNFDWIQTGGTYLAFGHTTGSFTVQNCRFGRAGAVNVFNVSTPGGTSASVDCTSGNTGPRAGSFFENDHGAGIDVAPSTSTIDWELTACMLPPEGGGMDTGTPRVSFFGSHDALSNDLHYQVEWDTAPDFSTSSTADSSVSATGFANLDDGGDTAPFTQGDRVGYTFQTALTSNTYWWRVRSSDDGGSTWSEWSPGRSLSNIAAGPTPPLAHFFNTTDAQWAINRLEGLVSNGSGGLELSNPVLGATGTLRTPWLRLADQRADGNLVSASWDEVVVNVTHPDVNTGVQVEVFDGTNTSIADSGPASNAGTVAVNLSGLGTQPDVIYVVVTLHGGSTPTLQDLTVDVEAGVTAVELTDLSATGYDGEAFVEWRTVSEVGNLGFNVYRSTEPQDGYVRLNGGLILGLGDDPTGGRYYFLDQDVVNGQTYYYRVEDVDDTGRVSMHGPVDATPDVGKGLASFDPADFVAGHVYTGGAGGNQNPDGSLTAGALLLAQGVRVVSTGAGSLDVELLIPGFERSSVTDSSANVYDWLEIPGYSPSTDMLKPVVPTRHLQIEVPPTISATLQGLATTSESFTGYSLPANLPAAPPNVSELGPVPSSHDGSTAWPAEALTIAQLAQQGDRTLIDLRVNPIAYTHDTGDIEAHSRIRATIVLGPVPSHTGGGLSPAQIQQARLATTAGVARLTVESDGIYRVTRDDLAALGFDVTGDPALLWLHARGESVPLRVLDGGDGSFDSGDTVEFFGQRNPTTFLNSTQTRYTDSHTYWLGWGSSPGPRVEEVDATPAPDVTPFQSYRAVARHEEQARAHWRGVSSVEQDYWFTGIHYAGGPAGDYDVELSAVAPPADAVLRYRVRGASSLVEVEVDHTVELSWNGAPLATLRFDGFNELSGELPLPDAPQGTNTITARIPGSGNDLVLVDFFEVEYGRRLQTDGQSLRFRQAESGQTRVENLADADVSVWDVSDPQRPRLLTGAAVEQVQGVFAPDGSLGPGTSHQVTFDPSGLLIPGDRDTLVVTPAAIGSPQLALNTPTQDLLLGGHGVDYLVITDRSLGAAADRLAAYRRGQGLRAQVVYVDEIFSEITGGDLDPRAIRTFLTHAYENWTLPRPKYVCLLGDGHYDGHDHRGFGRPSLVPPLLTTTEMSLAESDNLYGCVAGNDSLPDLCMGRIPVETLAEALAFLDKLEAYEAAPADPAWSESSVFLADDTDIHDFVAGSESLIARLPAGHAVTRAYYTGDAAAVKNTLLNTLNGDSALLTVYSGHGAPTVWGQEQFFSSYVPDGSGGFMSDADQLTNAARPTVGVALNCLSGVFATPDDITRIGEDWLLRDSGAVAFWASTGLTEPAPQQIMAEHLFDVVFDEGVGIVGDAADAAKVRVSADVGETDVVSTWVVLGDPATVLARDPRAVPQPNPMPASPPGPAVVNPPGPVTGAPVVPTTTPAPAAPASGSSGGGGAGCQLAPASEEGFPASPLLALAALLLLTAVRRR